MTDQPRQVFFGRPADTSQESFRRWIIETTLALGGKLDEISEEEWTRAWRRFWGFTEQ